MTYNTPEHIKKFILDNQEKESFYIYDLEVMRDKIKLLSMFPENVKTYYAMKANPHVEVVKEALKNPNITGIEVASQGEMNIVLDSGEQDLKRVIYTGPSKKQSELAFGVKNNIKYLNVESLKEAIVIDIKAEELGKKQKILLRLNTKHKFEKGEAGVTLGSGDTQFGFPQEEAEDYLKILERLENIEIDGFHMYPATGILKADVLLKSVESTFKFIKDIEEKTGKTFKTIDFGGGFGIDYGGEKEFELEKYALGLKKLIKKYSMQDKNLILELGRFLSADMGYFSTKINDIKTLKSGKKAVLCNAGTNALKRPQVLNQNYHVDIVETSLSDFDKKIIENAEKLGKNIETVLKEDSFNVYGPFCTSVDKILWDKTGKKIKLGDFVVVPQAGAYGKTMSPQGFLSHPEVEEMIINQKN